MFELLYCEAGYKYAHVLDTSDFVSERVSFNTLRNYLLNNIKIKGARLDNNQKVSCRSIEKSILYKDNDFLFLLSSVEVNDYQYNIEVYGKGGTYPLFSFGFNIWIEMNRDAITPKVSKVGANMYRVDLYGREIGTTWVLYALTKTIIKPVYNDKKYVKKDSPLHISCNGSTINIER